MSSLTFRGKPPDKQNLDDLRAKLTQLNEIMLTLEGDLVVNSPVDRGGLKGGWRLTPATLKDPSVTLSQNQIYFLPLELGRKPGTGLNQDGIDSVTLWAKRKLGLGERESKSLAYTYSRKLKREGSKAKGFAGLANEGDNPKPPSENLEPVQGGLIYEALRKIERTLT